MTGVRRLQAVIILAMACAAGCATPVGVRPTSHRAAYRHLQTSALGSSRPSIYSRQFLERLSLSIAYEDDPAGTLAALRAGLGAPDEQDRLFTLAELSFQHGMRSRDPRFHLDAALFAYLYLFPEDRAVAPIPYDPRLRLAMDLYNRAITEGLRTPDNGTIDLTARTLPLTSGTLELRVDESGFNYAGYRLARFISVEDFKIHGLRNHYRKPGIGAALSASADGDEELNGDDVDQWLLPGFKVPVTMLMRFDQPRQALEEGRLRAVIEVHDADVNPSTSVEGWSVPLESDPSATLAYGLDGSPFWDFEIAGFRRGDFDLFGNEKEGDLFFTSPYRPGRIPVVFVHGTASSPARWAEMVNELASDSRIARRYQFWFFIYNSGNPIGLSAMHLRERLVEALHDLDPEGRDAALRKVVVIGHSQGGLLAKMTAVHSGTRFWDTISKRPFEQARLSRDARDFARRSMFVEPLPFVQRLIFIATPHGGSYVAENLAGQLARRFITLPATLTKTSLELLQLDPAEAARTAIQIATAVDNMDSDSPFLRTLASLPIAPGVEAHSIIAVKGDGPPEEGRDGVVRYSSASIEGVASELVVRSGHSAQSHPHAIEEVRRILYEHAERDATPAPLPADEDGAVTLPEGGRRAE